MLNWFRQWRIRRLLVKLAYDQAWLDDMEKADKTNFQRAASIGATKEKLRQLGHTEEKKTLVRVGLPENYLKKMLDEANKIAGEQDNG